MPTTPTLYPLNDFAVTVGMKDVSLTTGRPGPLTTGTVTAFFATSTGPTATPADPSLSVPATHVGGGRWLVVFDAVVLTPSLLASLFGATPPVLMLVASGGVRAYVQCAYAASRAARVSG